MAIKLRNLPAPLTHDLEKAVNSSIQLIEKEKILPPLVRLFYE
jgi:hypothetical protein